MIETYTLAAFDCSATFEVDLDKIPESGLENINSFFGGDKSRLMAFDGSLIGAALSVIARQAIHIQFCEGYNLKGVINSFDFDNQAGHEGLPKIDGSTGIKLIDMESLEIGDFDLWKED